MRVGHTDTQRFLARKAKALGDDAGPRHHDRRTVHDGRFAPERIFVEELVKIETAERGAFFGRWTGQEFVLVEEAMRRVCASSVVAVAFAVLGQSNRVFANISADGLPSRALRSS
jgi:hypothetical protein